MPSNKMMSIARGILRRRFGFELSGTGAPDDDTMLSVDVVDINRWTFDIYAEINFIELHFNYRRIDAPLSITFCGGFSFLSNYI